MSLWRRILVERRSVVLPLAALLAINVVALVAVVLPLRQNVAGLEGARNAAYARRAAAKSTLEEAEQLTAGKKQTTAQLQRFYAQILAANFSSAMKAVRFWPAATAQALGLQYTGIETTQPTEIRESRLMFVTSRFSLRGEYANIRKFLYAVEAAEEFLIIDKVKLAQPTAQQANTPSLGFELSITTYYPGGGR
jgi:hypothetical protein